MYIYVLVKFALIININCVCVLFVCQVYYNKKENAIYLTFI